MAVEVVVSSSNDNYLTFAVCVGLNNDSVTCRQDVHGAGAASVAADARSYLRNSERRHLLVWHPSPPAGSSW